jgi:hypothetical protein
VNSRVSFVGLFTKTSERDASSKKSRVPFTKPSERLYIEEVP